MKQNLEGNTFYYWALKLIIFSKEKIENIF